MKKKKIPDPLQEEKKESVPFEPADFQLEEKPTKIHADYEWFGDLKGNNNKGFCQVVRGISIEIPKNKMENVLSKEVSKSFTILGELYFQKKEADRLRKEMEDAIGAKRVLGLKRSQIAKGTGTSPFEDPEVRRQIELGRKVVSAGKTKSDLAKNTRPDTERIVDHMMLYGLVDTYREKKKPLSDLFIKITDSGIHVYEKITSQADENDPLQYYYDVISGDLS